jgi:hypothetical protein
MAGERKRVSGELAAWIVASWAVMNGAPEPDIRKLNPYAPPEPVTPERVEVERDRFFSRLSVGLFGKNVFKPEAPKHADGGRIE